MNNYYTRLINREHPLPEDYIPPHLIDIGLPFEAVPGDPKRLLEEKAAYAALELISRSRREGLNLCGISGYRSYARQKKLYTGNPYVAPPAPANTKADWLWMYPARKSIWSSRKNSQRLKKVSG